MAISKPASKIEQSACYCNNNEKINLPKKYYRTKRKKFNQHFDFLLKY